MEIHLSGCCLVSCAIKQDSLGLIYSKQVGLIQADLILFDYGLSIHGRGFFEDSR